jgi:tetratricopeptide (TPR) repeat protein
VLRLTLEQQAIELLACNDFGRAYAAAEEGYRLCLDIGHGHGWHLVNMAAAEAVWGREEDARRHAGEALAVGQRSGSTFLASTAEMTLGVLELTMGQPDLAADRLLALTDPGRPGFNPIVALPALPDAVEAAVRAGRPAAAAERLAIAWGWIEGAPTQARRALLARCQALLGERDVEEAFSEAIEQAPALPPLEQARTWLLYGEWLRRERHRTSARAHLRGALELFQRHRITHRPGP